MPYFPEFHVKSAIQDLSNNPIHSVIPGEFWVNLESELITESNTSKTNGPVFMFPSPSMIKERAEKAVESWHQSH